MKNLGDGLMVAFPTSAADALSCVVEMQRAVARLTLEHPEAAIAVRIGVSVGEATHAVEEDDWFGPAVNVAARRCARAAEGQILAVPRSSAPDPTGSSRWAASS